MCYRTPRNQPTILGVQLLRSNLSPLVTVLVTPAVTHWRTHLRTCDQWHNLKTLALRSPKYELQYPWRHPLKINLGKCPFSISAGPQCLTRANGSVPPKSARPWTHCHRTKPAPPKIGHDFWLARTEVFFPPLLMQFSGEKSHGNGRVSSFSSMTTQFKGYSGTMPNLQ